MKITKIGDYHLYNFITQLV